MSNLAKFTPALAYFKKALTDPQLLANTLKDTAFKLRFEIHIDLICLPRGKESPNHDYAILYRNQKGDKNTLPKETLQQLIKNFAAATSLPIAITLCDVKKDGVIYHTVFLDVQGAKNDGKA